MGIEKKQSIFPSSRGAFVKIGSPLRHFAAGLENCFGCFLFLAFVFVFEASVFSPPVWLIADFVSHEVLSVSVRLKAAGTCAFRFRSPVPVVRHSGWLSESELDTSARSAAVICSSDMAKTKKLGQKLNQKRLRRNRHSDYDGNTDERDWEDDNKAHHKCGW